MMKGSMSTDLGIITINPEVTVSYTHLTLPTKLCV